MTSQQTCKYSIIMNYAQLLLYRWIMEIKFCFLNITSQNEFEIWFAIIFYHVNVNLQHSQYIFKDLRYINYNYY